MQNSSTLFSLLLVLSSPHFEDSQPLAMVQFTLLSFSLKPVSAGRKHYAFKLKPEYLKPRLVALMTLDFCFWQRIKKGKIALEIPVTAWMGESVMKHVYTKTCKLASRHEILSYVQYWFYRSKCLTLFSHWRKKYPLKKN